MRKKFNLMIGTDYTGQGGIATVVSIYQDEGLLSKHNFRYVPSHSSRDKTKLQALARHLKCLLTIIFYKLRFNIGIIHLHMASRGSYTRKAQIIRLGKYLGARIIIHLHGAEFKTFYEGECSSSKQKHIRDTFNMADKVIVLSSQWLCWINTIIDDTSKATLIHNTVPKVNVKAIHSDTTNILFLGRLSRRKGTGDLIRAFAQIANQFPESCLLLGGDGDINTYKSMTDELCITEQVLFLGWVSGQEKFDWMAKSSIYVLPSYNEGFPMGILEAMSAKIPVISSNAGGIPDAITNNKEGLLIQAGDIEALAAALKNMLISHDLRRKISQQAYAKYCNNFSPIVILPKLEKIYEELLSH